MFLPRRARARQPGGGWSLDVGAFSSLLQKSFQQRPGLDSLQLAQQRPLALCPHPPAGLFTALYKRKSVPLALPDQLVAKLRMVFGFQYRGRPPADFGKGLMWADASEPIFGIPIVRLAPVHDSVDKRAVGVFDFLCDSVGRVQVIVPEQNQRADKLLFFGRQLRACKRLI